MLFVLYLKEYTRLLRCSIIENQKNGDDTVITSQIIMIFTINWIIAHPYSLPYNIPNFLDSDDNLTLQ